MTAQERLTSALVALGRRRLPPCAGEGAWTADEADQRALAAVGCAPCPVFSECDAAAVEADEAFGVWGGVDRTKKTKKSTARTPEQRILNEPDQ